MDEEPGACVWRKQGGVREEVAFEISLKRWGVKYFRKKWHKEKKERSSPADGPAASRVQRPGRLLAAAWSRAAGRAMAGVEWGEH